MARSRSLARSVVLALTVLLGLVLLGGPASASSGQIGLSNDGVSFADRLVRPLFPSTFRWVPGDSMVRSFYVRNQSQDEGDLVILLAQQTGTMAKSGALRVATRLPGRSWTPLDGTTATGQAPMAIAPGKQTRVDVQVTFVGTATNATQLIGTEVGFVVNLSQDVTEVAAPRSNTILGLDVPVLGDPGMQLLLLTVSAAAAYAAHRHRRHRQADRSEGLRHV